MPQPVLPPGLDAFRPALRYRVWPDEAHHFVATAVERGAVSALLETKLFQAHELEAQLGLGRYRDLFDAELVRDAVVDTYLRFRRDWLVLARPTAKDHAQFFCAAVRNRVISGHRRWGARVQGEIDATPGEEDTLAQEGLITPAVDGRVEAAATLSALRVLAHAIDDPTRRDAILARLEGDAPDEIAARLQIKGSTERSWWRRFRQDAEDEGILLAA